MDQREGLSPCTSLTSFFDKLVGGWFRSILILFSATVLAYQGIFIYEGLSSCLIKSCSLSPLGPFNFSICLQQQVIQCNEDSLEWTFKIHGGAWVIIALNISVGLMTIFVIFKLWHLERLCLMFLKNNSLLQYKRQWINWIAFGLLVFVIIAMGLMTVAQCIILSKQVDSIHCQGNIVYLHFIHPYILAVITVVSVIVNYFLIWKSFLAEMQTRITSRDPSLHSLLAFRSYLE